MGDHPIWGNFLIRHDWRIWNSRWSRKPFFWIVLALASIQFIVCLWMLLLKSEREDEIDFLLPYFTAYHGMIYFVAPFLALHYVVSQKIRTRVEELRITPVPDSHIYWWLWVRCFAPVFFVIMGLYLPMLGGSQWLLGFDPIVQFSGRDMSGREVYFIAGELICDALLLGLIFMPWINSRHARRGIWLAAAMLMLGFGLGSAAFPKSLNNFTTRMFSISKPDVTFEDNFAITQTSATVTSGSWSVVDDSGMNSTTIQTSVTATSGALTIIDDSGRNSTTIQIAPGPKKVDFGGDTSSPLTNHYMVFATSYAHWHPLITILYFFISIGWNSALAVWLGLRYGRMTPQSLGILLLGGPIAEWCAQQIVIAVQFGTEWKIVAFYEPFTLCWMMLVFYSLSFGAFWMAVKWNLMIALGRRKLGQD